MANSLRYGFLGALLLMVVMQSLLAQNSQRTLDDYFELFTWEEEISLKQKMQAMGKEGEVFFVMAKNNRNGYIRWRERVYNQAIYTLITFGTNKEQTDLILFAIQSGDVQEYGFYEIKGDDITDVSATILPMKEIAVEYNLWIERWAFQKNIDKRSVKHHLIIHIPGPQYQIADQLEVSIALLANGIEKENVALGKLRFNGYQFEFNKKADTPY
jgi:hypothetical protein